MAKKNISDTKKVQQVIHPDGFIDPILETYYEVKVGRMPVRFEKRSEARIWKKAMQRFAKIVDKARSISKEIYRAGRLARTMTPEQKEAYAELVDAANKFNESLNTTIDHFG